MDINEQLEQIGKKILVIARNDLYLKMRFFDVALSSYAFVMDGACVSIGTDGKNLYFNPLVVGQLFEKDRVLLNRLYLHTVLHGLFCHMIRPAGLSEKMYDLSCDIVTESMIDSMRFPSVKRAPSWLRKQVYETLGKKIHTLTPLRVYRELHAMKLNEQELLKLSQEFRLDSHGYWPDPNDKESQMQMEDYWKEIREKSQTDLETFSKEEAQSAGHLVDSLRVKNREVIDYRTFLRKFAVLREEVKVDPETFDYVFYTYGLSYYGNMPLIEPQEFTEEIKIEDFVIVIDTSLSTSGRAVRKFLEQTYAVLSETNSFFRKVNIHIIQCDDKVETDRKITTKEELNDYMEHLDLVGEGGTDFRPAFSYVDQLLAAHAFGNLKGLLYFTDGQGIFPKKRPPYETAFIFLKEDYEEVNVPAWAMKLVIDIDDF